MLLILDVIAVYLIIKVLDVFVWPRVDSYLKKKHRKRRNYGTYQCIFRCVV